MENLKKIKKNKAFVILFAVILSSIILAIALGVSNIALKEVRFGTSARDTNDAFFAADTGAECVLFNDKTTTNKFPLAGPATSITCGNVSLTPTFSGTSTTANYNFTLTGLGSAGRSCAKVNVFKTGTAAPTWTYCSDEFGTCNFSGTKQVRYGAGSSWAYQSHTGSVSCDNNTFGDPAFNTAKACYYTSQPITWTQCAVEGGTCNFSGTKQIRYGAGSSFAYQTRTTSVSCSNGTFGDPAPGQSKACSYAGPTTSSIDTTITSNGYNTGDSSCNSTSTSLVERELHVDY